jgi:excisionase family DNA binding protein
MSEELLTTAEVAKRLGLTLRAVQKMIEGDRLEAKKIGRDYLVRADALDNITRRSAAGRPKKGASENTSGPTSGGAKKR